MSGQIPLMFRSRTALFPFRRFRTEARFRRTFPTYCMSVPVYSSSRKNWFHIQPRLERLRGTPLASCPVSPADPLRPPVVLRRALRPWPGEPTKAAAHSTTRTQSFRLSMATARGVSLVGVGGLWSELSPHAGAPPKLRRLLRLPSGNTKQLERGKAQSVPGGDRSEVAERQRTEVR